MPATGAADLSMLVGRMQHLKAEHRELVQLIAGDPGMAAATRQALLAHLMEEEDEIVAQMAGSQPPTSAAGDRPGLTVGSLRVELPPSAINGLGAPRRR